jgi:hypothetical protein
MHKALDLGIHLNLLILTHANEWFWKLRRGRQAEKAGGYS